MNNVILPGTVTFEFFTNTYKNFTFWLVRGAFESHCGIFCRVQSARAKFQNSRQFFIRAFMYSFTFSKQKYNIFWTEIVPIFLNFLTRLLLFVATFKNLHF